MDDNNVNCKNKSIRTVLITGITGTLGSALGEYYRQQGWNVIGVTRKNTDRLDACDKVVVNLQQSPADAQHLLSFQADLIILNAGAIETAIGPAGEPLSESIQSLTTVNFMFPALVALEAAASVQKPLDMICIGSIADCSPSCFGPVYHASKIALHYFIQGTSPILQHANPMIRLRLYRPGVILGPLSWAPINRLNEKGIRIRSKRCQQAPSASVIARRIDQFRCSRKTIASDRLPLSFRLLKIFFILAPELFSRVQRIAWRSASAFVKHSD
ncbi:SDR family oxidoreductase [bacterium]|nr:SDR family oxidoreductase [candidate division CSSED10-310 bacterium]